MPGIVRAVEGLEAGPMTAASWGCCAARRRLGELLTRGDVCHVHADRGEAERCGVLLGGAPELVRLDEVRPAVYRVAWSLSSAASGRLRRRLPGLGNHDSRRPSVARLLATCGWQARPSRTRTEPRDALPVRRTNDEEQLRDHRVEAAALEGPTRGGGRRVRHGTAAMAAGGGGAEPVPLEGDLGERLGRSPRTSVPVALAVAAERSAGRR